VLAICQHYEIDRQELLGYQVVSGLTVVSGHDFPMVIGTADRQGVTFTENVKYLEGSDHDVIILDPFVSIHHCPENENTMMDAIIKRLGKIASSAGPLKAIEILHHPRKSAQGGPVEINGADSRGAHAIFAGVRSMRVGNRMTEGEALRAKVEDSRAYFRIDTAKANYAASATASAWYRHVSVILPNGDDVGVIVPWRMPGAFDGVTAAHTRQVRDLARDGKHRADPRAEGWIGSAVAVVLDLDAESEADRKRIKVILKEWYRTGVLKKVEKTDDARHVRLYVEPGEWVEP
jgi:hypothetical protein